VKKRLLVDVLFLGILSILISGCSYPISKAVRQEAAQNLAFKDVLARPPAYRGIVVIWGGVVIKTVTRPGRSELVLSEAPLDLRGRPEGQELSSGLFIARTSEFLDPAKYYAGRKVTVAGVITGAELGTHNGAPYVYPLVEIKELHLWREPIKWNWGRIPYYWPNQYSPQQQYRQSLH
jgi:outer membrane lipoprotein